MAPHKSIAWSFFTAKDGFAICSICSAKLKYKTSTSSLLTHVKSKHPIHLGELQNERRKESKASSADVVMLDAVPSSSVATVMAMVQPSVLQPTLPAAIEYRKLYDVSSTRRLELDRILLQMITLDLQPFTIVENRGFRRYSKAMDPRYPLPSRTKLSTCLLPAYYNEEKGNVYVALQAATSVALTTDIWSSRAMQGYMTVTAHFVTEKWEMESFVLETARMTESHTAENIASRLSSVMEDWNITDKISAVVTDNAANVVKAVSLLKQRHLGCFAHSLNLVVTTALKDVHEIKPVIDRVKEIVGFFHRSVKASDSLRDLQSQQNPDHRRPLKLINDVPTRWNSTFYMLERYVKLHTQVTASLCLSGKPNLCLSTEQVEQLEVWIKDLQPFELVTREISAEKTTTAAKIIPIVQLLHNALKRTSSNLAEQLHKQLSLRFPSPQNKFVWAASTFLDPRFKKHAFTDLSALQEVQENLKTRMKPVDDPEPRPRSETQSQATDSFWSTFDTKIQSYLSATANPSVKPNTEMRRLQEEDPIGRDQDPLKWWKEHEALFPQLHSLARRYLAIPATSVPSERLFSTAGELVSTRRANLGDENINMILFLNKSFRD